MTTANCVVKTTKGCTKKTKKFELKDRLHKNFIVMNYCNYCYNVNGFVINGTTALSKNKSVMTSQAKKAKILNKETHHRIPTEGQCTINGARSSRVKARLNERNHKEM